MMQGCSQTPLKTPPSAALGLGPYFVGTQVKRGTVASQHSYETRSSALIKCSREPFLEVT